LFDRHRLLTCVAVQNRRLKLIKFLLHRPDPSVQCTAPRADLLLRGVACFLSVILGKSNQVSHLGNIEKPFRKAALLEGAQRLLLGAAWSSDILLVSGGSRGHKYPSRDGGCQGCQRRGKIIAGGGAQPTGQSS